MPANIQDVHGELEALNASIGRLVLVNQEGFAKTTAAVAKGAGGGGGHGGGTRGVITGIVEGFHNTPYGAKSLFFLGQVFKGQVIAYEMIKAVDDLQYANIESGRDVENVIKKMMNEEGVQLGGVKENLQMILSMQEAGLDVAYGGKEEGSETSRRLREQLVMLDKAGGQGQLLLGYTKQLASMGFTRSEAHEQLQSLADIAYTSIQSATTQKEMLKKMSENVALLKVADPELAASLLAVEQSKFFIDATDVQKQSIAQMMNFLISPKGTEQLNMWARIGGQGFQDTFKLLGQEMIVAGTDKDKQAVVQNKLMDLVSNLTQSLQSMGQEFFGGRTTLERGYMERDPFFKELMDFLRIAAGAMRGIETQRQVDKDRGSDKDKTYVADFGAIRKVTEDNVNVIIDSVSTYAFKSFIESASKIRGVLMEPIQWIAERLIDAYSGPIAGLTGSEWEAWKQLKDAIGLRGSAEDPMIVQFTAEHIAAEREALAEATVRARWEEARAARDAIKWAEAHPQKGSDEPGGE